MLVFLLPWKFRLYHN